MIYTGGPPVKDGLFVSLQLFKPGVQGEGLPLVILFNQAHQSLSRPDSRFDGKEELNANDLAVCIHWGQLWCPESVGCVDTDALDPEAVS